MLKNSYEASQNKINQSKDINNKNKSIINTQMDQNNNIDREEFEEELEDKFYYDIPIKDFKKKSQLRESGNFFSLKREEMTPQNQTQNLNNYYQGGINNTNTHSNLSNNNNTNNQFNFSKNNINFLNNFNVAGNNNNNEINKDKNKREIIEDILRDTSNGSFLAKIENERPFTPPFTKLVPTNNLVSLDKDKVNTSSISKENLLIVNAKNIVAGNNNNNNVNSSILNLNNKSIELNPVNVNKSNIGNNASNNNPNNNLSKIEENNVDRSYMIKDINYMDLQFDHVLGYYFDPKTNVYYELKTNNLINQE